ncbi:hypothetical protein BH10ACT8_BH10ACT8_05470 [soil metagenome]
MSLLLEHYRSFEASEQHPVAPAAMTAPSAGEHLAAAPLEQLPARGESAVPVVDIMIPVYNEVHSVAASVQKLHRYLSSTLPSSFRITVVDNASTDETWTVLRYLHRTLEHVSAVRLADKGRGLALRTTWTQSDATVLAYMDVDLSTDLDAVLPLLAPLLSGHSDIAIGSRLARGARVVRGRKRDLISRCYNLILARSLHVKFTDAQCGFKAITRDAAQLLLPLVVDDGWFFDTELLVLAERSGLRIYEVPVDWIDDPDSRVELLSTAWQDLKGVRRLRASLSAQAKPLAEIGARLTARTAPPAVAGPSR